mgnify:CR=1 FL=1
MKVYLNNYRHHWLSPYTIIDYLFFWTDWSHCHRDKSLARVMLRQLQSKNHSAPFVDDTDVPEELMSTSAPPKKNEWDTDENHFKRWDWVMVEMIFAFECKLDDTWQEKFSSGEFDKLSVPVDHLGNEVPKKNAKLFHFMLLLVETSKSVYDSNHLF